jgi:protein translocase SecG subunit
METLINIGQMVCAGLLIIFVLLQVRGTGFSRGSAKSFTRRGAEKLIFRLTFVLASVFLLLSFLNLIY